MGDKTFRPITDVEVVESVNAEDTVLIEQDGVAKRAPKGSIGAQSDWNETDESSPAFIKNKPDVGGGGVMWIKGLSLSSGPKWEDGTPVTAEAFKEAFASNTIVYDGDNYESGYPMAHMVVSYWINDTTSRVTVVKTNAVVDPVLKTYDVNFASE